MDDSANIHYCFMINVKIKII